MKKNQTKDNGDAPAVDVREEKKLDAELVKVADAISELVRGDVRHNLDARYAVGEHVRGVQKDARHGEKAVKKLAVRLRHLGLSKKTLENTASVVQNIGKEEFKELATRRGGTKEKPFLLGWSHVVELAVPDGRNRKRLANETFDEKLSVGKLRARKRELYGEGDAKGGAEGAAVADIGRAVRGLTGALQGLLGKPERSKETFAALDAMDPKALPEPMQKAVSTLHTQLLALAEFAADGLKKTERLVGKLPTDA